MRSKVARRILEETPLETVIFVRKYAEIVARIHDILHEKGLTQRDLALRMGKNPSELSRWLAGEHNLTLRSLAKLEAELGEDIISVHRSHAPSSELPKQALAPHAAMDTAWTDLLFSVSHSRAANTCIA